MLDVHWFSGFMLHLCCTMYFMCDGFRVLTYIIHFIRFIRPLTLGKNQLMWSIYIIDRPWKISNDAWIFRLRRKLFVWRKDNVARQRNIGEERLWNGKKDCDIMKKIVRKRFYSGCQAVRSCFDSLTLSCISLYSDYH